MRACCCHCAERLAARLEEMDLMVAAELEFDCVLPMAAMELAGVYLDAGLLARSDQSRARRIRHRD